MRIEPFTADHYRRLALQPAQVRVSDYFTEADAEAMVQFPSFSGIADDGTVLAVGGVYEPWKNRAVAWMLLAGDLGPHMVCIHRAIVRFLDLQQLPRVEATVREGFEPGHRWVKMLGFTCETPNGMKAYSPDGETHYQYARVRP